MCPASNYAFSLKPGHFSSRGRIEDKKQTLLPAINKDCFLEKGRPNKAFQPCSFQFSDGLIPLTAYWGACPPRRPLPRAPVANCADGGDVKVRHAGQQQWLLLRCLSNNPMLDGGYEGLSSLMPVHERTVSDGSLALPGGGSCPDNTHMQI